MSNRSIPPKANVPSEQRDWVTWAQNRIVEQDAELAKLRTEFVNYTVSVNKIITQLQKS